VVEGKHDGKNLANIIFEILKEAVLLGIVSTSMLSENEYSGRLPEYSFPFGGPCNLEFPYQFWIPVNDYSDQGPQHKLP